MPRPGAPAGKVGKVAVGDGDGGQEAAAAYNLRLVRTPHLPGPLQVRHAATLLLRLRRKLPKLTSRPGPFATTTSGPQEVVTFTARKTPVLGPAVTRFAYRASGFPRLEKFAAADALPRRARPGPWSPPGAAPPPAPAPFLDSLPPAPPGGGGDSDRPRPRGILDYHNSYAAGATTPTAVADRLLAALAADRDQRGGLRLNCVVAVDAGAGKSRSRRGMGIAAGLFPAPIAATRD